MRARTRAGLNRAILDQCWGEFERQLNYKMTWAGGELWEARARNSSNECEASGHVDPENRESQAVFRCQACGHLDHADRNAALNILARGLHLLATGERVPAHAPGHGAACSRQPSAEAAAAGTTLEAA